MVDINEVRELRKELNEFQLEMVGRMARIEERLDHLVPRSETGKASPIAADNGSAQALSRVSIGLVELGKEFLRVVLAVIATLTAIALRQGGGNP